MDKKQALAVALQVQRKNKKSKMANGGAVGPNMDKEKMADINMAKDQDSFDMEGHAASIADAIMHKRKMMAQGGEVDLSMNADEDKNLEDDLSFEALKKENYSESAGLEDLDYDISKSIGDKREMDSENKKDLISAIRSKIKAKLA